MITVAELTDKHRSLTNREYLSLHGTLSLDRIEALVEMEAVISGQEGALNYIDEAKGSFPGEDFLNDIISNLRTLVKHLRGANKEELNGIIEKVEGLQTSTTHESEYGLEQLKAAKAMIYEPLQNRQ